GVFGGLGPAEVGLLGVTGLVVTSIFQILCGIMSDRRDPSRFLPIGIAILGIGSLAASLSWNFWSLLLIVALSRIGASFYHPVGISWIGREFEGPALDHSMGFQSAFGDAGVILGIASSAVLAVALGWQSPFLLWGGINLAAVAVGLSASRGRSSPPHLATRSISDYVGVLRDVRRWLLPLALVGAVWTVLVVMWTLGSALFLTYPALFSFVSESSHRRLQGAAFGLVFGFQLVGGAIGVYLAGVLANAFGSDAATQTSIPFLFAGLLGLAGFIALLAGRPCVATARNAGPSPIPPL